MSALIFLGQSFTDDASFARAYPAYGYYAKLVRAGADSPHKIEIELHRQFAAATQWRAAWLGPSTPEVCCMSEHVRQIKRYKVALRRDGACRFCVHGQKTDASWHCRNAPGKTFGACMARQDSYPKFQVVENVLEEFADAA